MAPLDYCLQHRSTISLLVGRSVANQCYLGHYNELFDDENGQSLLTWPALAWILEDYGLSITEPVAADLIYKHVSGSWSFEASPGV